MSEKAKNRQAARDRFVAIGKDAPDEELDNACSAMHLGLLLQNMIECIDKAREVAPKLGVDFDSDDYTASLTTATIISQKTSGENYKVTLALATAAECEEFKLDMEKATELPTPD